MAFAITKVSMRPATNHHARDHQCRALQDETLQADRQAGEGIVDGDDNRHVRTADGNRHQNTEQRRSSKEDADARSVYGGRAKQQIQAEGDCHREQSEINNTLQREAKRVFENFLQFRPSDDRARKRDGADERAQQRDSEWCRAGRVMAEQLNRGNGARGTTAHAIIDGDHLGHGRHGDFAAGKPGDAGAETKGQHREANIDDKMRHGGRRYAESTQKTGENGNQHSETGKGYARRCRDRR
jgi:hypothetical protein